MFWSIANVPFAAEQVGNNEIGPLVFIIIFGGFCLLAALLAGKDGFSEGPWGL